MGFGSLGCGEETPVDVVARGHVRHRPGFACLLMVSSACLWLAACATGQGGAGAGTTPADGARVEVLYLGEPLIAPAAWNGLPLELRHPDKQCATYVGGERRVVGPEVIQVGVQGAGYTCTSSCDTTVSVVEELPLFIEPDGRSITHCRGFTVVIDRPNP